MLPAANGLCPVGEAVCLEVGVPFGYPMVAAVGESVNWFCCEPCVDWLVVLLFVLLSGSPPCFVQPIDWLVSAILVAGVVFFSLSLLLSLDSADEVIFAIAMLCLLQP